MDLAPLLFKILQFSPIFTRMKDMWCIKTSEGQKNATSKHYLSPSYPPFSLSSKLHSQTHLPYTPTILANGRQGAIGMVPKAPPTNTHGDFHLLRKATWWLSIFTFCLSPACTFWSLRKCKKRYEIEILKLLSKKWKLKSCIWVSFFPFLHYFLSSSSQSRKEEWSQLWLVPTRNSKWAGWIINGLGV